jgi:hypothetical protein
MSTATHEQTAKAVAAIPRTECNERAWVATRDLAGRVPSRFLLAFIACWGELSDSGYAWVNLDGLAGDCGIPASAIDDVLDELERHGALMVAMSSGRNRIITFPALLRTSIAKPVCRPAKKRRRSSALESALQH